MTTTSAFSVWFLLLLISIIGFIIFFVLYFTNAQVKEGKSAPLWIWLIFIFSVLLFLISLILYIFRDNRCKIVCESNECMKADIKIEKKCNPEHIIEKENIIYPQQITHEKRYSKIKCGSIEEKEQTNDVFGVGDDLVGRIYK